MSQNFSLKYFSGRTFYILILLIFGFISSQALISIATAALFINFIFSYKEHRLKFVNLAAFPILAAILFFLACLLFLPFTNNYLEGLKNLWIKIPWLFIPLSIAALGKQKKDFVYFFLAFLILILCISGIIVLVNYYSNYRYITEQISIAKHIPTPMNHIRYSLMLAFAGATSIYLFIKNETRITPWDRKLFAFSSIFFFVLIHVLSVRSGLISYYIALSYLFIYFSVQWKKWWIFPVFIIFMTLVPILAYYSVNSFKNKVDYMRYDLQQLQEGNIGHNSDSRRIVSLKMGWELFKEKPLIGHGLGCAEQVTANYYQKYFPEVEEQNQKIPHNQFLFTALELGSIGLVFLISILILPLYGSFLFKNPIFLMLWLIIVASCFVENTFESQLGMSFYLVFASLTLKLQTHD